MNKKKLLLGLLFCCLCLVVTVSASLVYYLSNTITARVMIDSSIGCVFEETGTDYYYIEDIVKTGEQIVIEYTPVCDNSASSSVDTFPVTMMGGPTRWEGNEFDSWLSCSVGEGDVIACIELIDYLYYVDDYGELHPFSEIGEDDNIYSTAKIFIDYDGDGVAQKSPLASGTTTKSVIITFNPNIAAGYYSMGYCHLNEIAEQCESYYF